MDQSKNYLQNFEFFKKKTIMDAAYVKSVTGNSLVEGLCAVVTHQPVSRIFLFLFFCVEFFFSF